MEELGAMKTCIVVDDADVVRRIARRMLEREGLTVVEAESGTKALQICRERMPDLILLDLHMPIMEGTDFLKLLRQEKDGGIPKVIICTIEYDVEQINAAMQEGANAYLLKPFDSSTLMEALSEVGIASGKSQKNL